MASPAAWPRIKDIVGAALEREASERVAFLDHECSGDDELRNEVDSLLVAYDKAESLSQPRWIAGFCGVSEIPRSIGPYRLVRELGAGGMGQVWLADQSEPVRRQVAIKLIRSGLYDRHLLQRFASERQSLASMNHPSIAKVFDAGATPDGQPYLVMEYVDGCPITEYCDRHKLPLADRLRLFTLVCDGVQHAHQKAIIHRDLKPSNILVTEVDGKPLPQIIDFGAAKELFHGADARSMFTQMGTIIGTLGYMSPEQSQPDATDIDTRTDVYSLGVVLYELLVGALPFDPAHIRSYASLQRFRENDALKPSAKFRSRIDSAAQAAMNRGADIEPLIRHLDGDLDSIALKALENDRRRRYATPAEFAADIGRYLRNEPVAARAPTLAYRAEKYIRRHRLRAALLGSVLVVSVVFVISQAVQLRNTQLERDRADRVTDFVKHIFKISDPSEARGSTVTAREILDKASREIESEAGLDTNVRSELMAVMADTYLGLGLYARAHTLAESSLQARRQSLGAENVKTLESMKQLGAILFAEGRHVEAEAMLRQTQGLQIRILGPNHLATLNTESALVTLLIRNAHYTEAETLARQIVATATQNLGPDNAFTLRSSKSLASALAGESRFDEAETIYRRVLAAERQSLGNDHPDTVLTLHSLANMLQAQGRYREAEVIYRETLVIQQRVLGPDHPETANTLTTLANDIRHDGTRHAESEQLYRTATAIEMRVVGPENTYTTRAQEGLANLLNNENRRAEAEPLFREVLKARLKVLGPDNTDVLLTQYNLGDSLNDEGRFAEAETLFRMTIQQQMRVLDPDDPDLLASKYMLADVLLKEGRPREAEPWARQAFDAELRVLGPQHEDTLQALSRLGLALARLGRYDEAEAVFHRTIAQIEGRPKGDAAQAWFTFACMAAQSGHLEDALDHLERAVQLGYSDSDNLLNNPGLASIRQNLRFAQIVRRVEDVASSASQKL